MFNLTNKTTIITGGGSGIGRAIAELFAKQEGKVFILDVDDAGGNSTAEAIKANGGAATFVKCNIGNSGETESVVKKIAAESSSIDIVVNNAGIAHVGTAESTSDADFERLFNVNVKGATATS